MEGHSEAQLAGAHEEMRQSLHAYHASLLEEELGRSREEARLQLADALGRQSTAALEALEAEKARGRDQARAAVDASCR
eukprot:COSAG01_NODE_6551_length_3614_cov_2.669513_4_plen_79_part_00